MPAFDECHSQVVRALEKDGWHVQRSPLKLRVQNRLVYIDIQLWRGLNGNRRQIMLVEVKCFPDSANVTQEIYTMIGQYLLYRAMLKEVGMTEPLFLAVPQHMYVRVFDNAVRRVVRESGINVVVIDIKNEVVVQWIGTLT